MRKFMIEREIEGVGSFETCQLRQAANTSNEALDALGPGIQWQHSYVTDDRTYCIYLAENEELIRAHAERSGFPANRITEIETIIDPTTANAGQA